MRKEHQRYYENASQVPEDPDRYVITLADLEGKEVEIYHKVLAKLKDPTSDQLQMVATYAFLKVKMALAVADENKPLALYIRKCMIYARNRLGLWKPIPINAIDLLLDTGAPGEQDWPIYPLYLDPDWKIGQE
jgi:hypothetical protein